MKFVFRTLLIAILLLIFYNFVLLVFPKIQNQFTAQHWWQENKIKAERFYHNKINYDIVIVGTSMSEGIILDQVTEKCLTLNFIGGSSLTGLELIKRSSKIPKVIVIETNWLERTVNEDLVNYVTNPKIGKIASIMPSLLECNQPVNVLASFINPRPTFTDSTNTKRYFSENLQQNIKSENTVIDTLKVEENIKKAGNLINYFKDKGVKVYLMELPIDQQLYHGNRSSVNRYAVGKYLGNFDSIPKFRGLPLATADGYHFTLSSKQAYIDHLTNFLLL